MLHRPAVVLFAASLLGAACIANPTPHPGNEGGGTVAPAADAGASADTWSGGGAKASDICATLGGLWDEASGECTFGEANADDGGFMGETPTSGGVDLDGLYNAVGPHVLGVAAAGEPGAYTFSVTLESPDTGCDAYADWWEVVAVDGSLIYRRILLHPHVEEQPFTRDGGPVDVAPDALVLVRAHMSTGGYGQQMMAGSAEAGFVPARLETLFALDLETAEPLPEACTP